MTHSTKMKLGYIAVIFFGVMFIACQLTLALIHNGILKDYRLW